MAKKSIKGSKDVVQSYIWSVAKYESNVYEKRVLYRMIEAVQWVIEGKELRHPYPYYQGRNIFKDYVFKFPTSHFLIDEDQNHVKIHAALKSLKQRSVDIFCPEEVPGEGAYIAIVGLIERPKYGHERGWVEFAIPEGIAEGLLSFTKGFRKYELLTAMNLKSSYSMRLYELLSGQKYPITYTIQSLKEMFGIAKKYALAKDFLARVIEPARIELDSAAPYSFTYEVNKLGRKFHSITFTPVYQPEYRDAVLEQKSLSRGVALSWDLTPQFRELLHEQWEFTTEEIKRNRELFIEAQNNIDDLARWQSSVRARANRVKNPKGYFINAIKMELEYDI